MKKLIILLLLILLIPSTMANLYQQDSLTIEVTIDNSFDLVKKSDNNARVQEVKANLKLLAHEDYRQNIIKVNTKGEINEDSVEFIWKNPAITDHEVSYKATVKTNDNRIQVKNKYHFPIDNNDIYNLDQYLVSSKTIDHSNQDIINMASKLAEGEDDLFKVAFNLANWVEENIEYDLNTLTSKASQSASWVLENKQGVCDEMTTLFIAMSRSVGIPARFVSGISYTEHEGVVQEVGSNWAPHGWAEVYFPDLGWVSFDIAFNEFGYIDVTHVKLRENADPVAPAIEFSWLANNVDLQTSPLKIDASIIEQGSIVPEAIEIELELLRDEIGFGSFMLVKGILKNSQDYYAATTLRLATPQEITIFNNNKRTILLKPKEVKETYWVIQVDENLNNNFIYEFPVIMYSEKNASIENSFSSQKEAKIYSKQDIEALTIQDEDKTYSRKLSFSCDYQNKLKVDQDNLAKCIIKNTGNSNLQNLNLCIGGICESKSLPINQQQEIKINLDTNQAGSFDFVVSAINDLVEKNEIFEYMVLDQPKISTSINTPATINFNAPIDIELSLSKESYAIPQEINVILEGPGFEQRWEISSLQSGQNLTLNLAQVRTSFNNKLTLTTQWKDEDGFIHSNSLNFTIKGIADNFSQKVRMSLNSILNLFN